MSMMRLAMIGDGRMGLRIAGLAESHRFTTVMVLGESENRDGSAITPEAFSGVDVAIDFTHPASAMTNIRKVVQTGTPIVVGTTGWLTEQNREELTKLIEHKQGRVLYGSNFSLGVQLFIKLMNRAGMLFGRAEDFDASVHEVHHTGKADAPSGTAITLAEQFLAGAGSNRKPKYGVPERGTVDKHGFRITSQRVGDVYGDHEIRIHSPWDDIKLTHSARSRDGFAAGALRAARWLVNKEPGFYLIEDVVEEIISSENA
jgi:4-hydroxy-tetrahydrodipicolinate reductase